MLSTILAVIFLIISLLLVINLKTEVVPVSGARICIVVCILVSAISAWSAPVWWIHLIVLAAAVATLAWSIHDWRKPRRRGVVFTLPQLASRVIRIAGSALASVMMLVSLFLI